MENLLLNSLEIRNFRGFRHLTIEKLGRVNLIVGKNNVGKTALLEALHLYARRGALSLIRELLEGRDESKLSLMLTPFFSRDSENLLPSLKYLFYGRQDVNKVLDSIQIGPMNLSEHTLAISVGGFSDLNTVDDKGPRLSVHFAGEQIINQPLGVPLSLPLLALYEAKSGPTNVFVAANGLGNELLGKLWDGIALTSLHKETIQALQMLAPGVEDVGIVGDPGAPGGRIPIVKVAAVDERLPLGSLGNGMQRILGISLALVNARKGFLLIDEIENDIHYSVQKELWQLVFRLAHRLDVQVFATTHSWDCIEGFQKAAEENKQEEGMLIRLSLKGSEITATLFDEEELGVVTREQIEVR
jgi:ABC-type transport system involved in cytochrome c biogenesis ATPase subunit